MFSTATIVFREFLEIALVLTILMAATQGVSNRNRFILFGLTIGVLGSIIIAFFTEAISNAIDGVGQEIFNAAIMFIAVGFLSWTVLWMTRYGREMSAQLREAGSKIQQGEAPIAMLTGIVALATFREGAEIVLFTYGMAASGHFSVAEIITGGVMGAVSGTMVGVALYFGLLKTAQRYLFTVTSWLLIFVTAGMAAKGTSFLVAADVVPALSEQLWDSSHIIAGNSFMGELLGVLVGYVPRPSGVELLVYLCVLAVIGSSYLFIKRGQHKPA